MRYVTSLLTGLLVQLTFPSCAVPHFEVDLDKKPEERWVDVAKHYKDEMIAMAPVMLAEVTTHLGENMGEFLKYGKFDAEHEAELQGIAHTIGHANVTLDSMKYMNMLYEMQSPLACSGVLWGLPNGTVMHGRNMDYAFHFYMPDGRLLNWPDITHEVTFLKGGKPLMKGTQWPGGIGLATAMRFDGWSVQQNTRLSQNNWQANLEAAKNGGQPFSLVLRKVMENTKDFKTAVSQLYDTSFMAPQYFVISGAGKFEGAVLTIDRLGKHEPGTPPIQNVTKDSWHLVQTNDDLLGLPSDARRPLADELLQESDQSNGTTARLAQFMHTSFLFNELTVYSVVMVPATGYYKTILPTEAPDVRDGTLEMDSEHQQLYATSIAAAVEVAKKSAAAAPGNASLSQISHHRQQEKVAPLPLPVVIAHRKKGFLAARMEEAVSFMQESMLLVMPRASKRSTAVKNGAQTQVEDL